MSVNYQNRRFDGDFLTVKQIILNGLLGEIVEYQSNFERYNPGKRRTEWKERKGLLFMEKKAALFK